MVGGHAGDQGHGAAVARCSVMRRTCVSSTQGRANYSMQFKQYEEAPRSVSEEIIAKVQGKDSQVSPALQAQTVWQYEV